MGEYRGYIVNLSADWANKDGEKLTEIVRCRDCDNATEAIWPESSGIPADWLNCHGELVETWDYYNDEPKDNPVPPDGFCMYGERKKGGDA